jgi:hypothetical protein
MMDTITSQINLFHQQSPLDFCVMNGDLIHNDKSFMPLVKSKSPEAFRKNVAAEVKSGKPVKQAVAIAYSVKREAAKPAKKK